MPRVGRLAARSRRARCRRRRRCSRPDRAGPSGGRPAGRAAGDAAYEPTTGDRCCASPPGPLPDGRRASAGPARLGAVDTAPVAAVRGCGRRRPPSRMPAAGCDPRRRSGVPSRRRDLGDRGGASSGSSLRARAVARRPRSSTARSDDDRPSPGSLLVRGDAVPARRPTRSARCVVRGGDAPREPGAGEPRRGATTRPASDMRAGRADAHRDTISSVHHDPYPR